MININFNFKLNFKKKNFIPASRWGYYYSFDYQMLDYENHFRMQKLLKKFQKILEINQWKNKILLSYIMSIY